MLISMNAAQTLVWVEEPVLIMSMGSTACAHPALMVFCVCLGPTTVSLSLACMGNALNSRTGKLKRFLLTRALRNSQIQSSNRLLFLCSFIIYLLSLLQSQLNISHVFMYLAWSYFCQCEAGWMGQHCEQEKDECLPNPCQNGGSCLDRHNGFTCVCQAGYRGKYNNNYKFSNWLIYLLFK